MKLDSLTGLNTGKTLKQRVTDNEAGILTNKVTIQVLGETITTTIGDLETELKALLADKAEDGEFQAFKLNTDGHLRTHDILIGNHEGSIQAMEPKVAVLEADMTQAKAEIVNNATNIAGVAIAAAAGLK